MIKISQIHNEIDLRVNAIRADNPDWLCRRGCDGCCHRLAEIPSLTEQEWQWLLIGITALPAAQQEAIKLAISTLNQLTPRPITCPLLDLAKGECSVYAHRPLACRTYGFYLQRDKGLYCQEIESLESAGALSEVVWGNQDAIDHCAKDLGMVKDLTEWFVLWNTLGTDY